jgi:hypothetical protein
MVEIDGAETLCGLRAHFYESSSEDGRGAAWEVTNARQCRNTEVEQMSL